MFLRWQQIVDFSEKVVSFFVVVEQFLVRAAFEATFKASEKQKVAKEEKN